MSFYQRSLKLTSLLLRFCLIASVLLSSQAMAQDDIKLKVALAYNFAKFTHWPKNNMPTSSWQVCYLGEKYRDEFRTIKNKKIAKLPIDIHQVNTVDEATNCHVLYISQEYQRLLQPLMVLLQDTSTLTISDIPDFINLGGMIEIISSENRLQFKINYKHMQEVELQLASQVLNLAIEVKQRD